MINEYESLILENNQLKEKIILLENIINDSSILHIYNDMFNKNTEINNLKIANEKLEEKIVTLENKINFLESENKQFKIENNKLKEDIKELKNENKKLKEKITDLQDNNKELREEIKELKEEIKELKEEIKELREEIKILKEENKELKEENKELKEEKKISKIKILLQDINSSENLEVKLQKISRQLKRLRNNRNDFCHFIFDDDTPELINLKKIYLLDKLSNFNGKHIIDSIYTNGFIDEIILYLKNNITEPTNISENDLEILEDLHKDWDNIFIFH